jgi:hypothetical protein
VLDGAKVLWLVFCCCQLRTGNTWYRHTVMIAAELHQLILQCLQDGVDSINRCLVWCMLLAELYGLFGCHRA